MFWRQELLKIVYVLVGFMQFLSWKWSNRLSISMIRIYLASLKKWLQN